MEQYKKKIAFCITSMNRARHLKETLKKNMDDNNQPDEAEFVLMDYNSTDGLEEWVRSELTLYITSGLLVYYKTLTPATYLRSHSRNMAFRLSDARIVCNLDADNFLGRGFARFMIDEFDKYENIFYLSNLTKNIYGRVCLLREDFDRVRGYNEAFSGYGYEDDDLYNRLRKIGLFYKQFFIPAFSRSIDHAGEDRVSEEYYTKNIRQLFLHYINPFSTKLLLLLGNGTFETGVLVDNRHLSRNIFDSSIAHFNMVVDKRFRNTIEGGWTTGALHETETGDMILTADNQSVTLLKRGDTLIDGQCVYHKLTNEQLLSDLFSLLTEALNYMKSADYCNDESITHPEINKEGYGRGTVYRNFNYEYEIVLK